MDIIVVDNDNILKPNNLPANVTTLMGFVKSKNK